MKRDASQWIRESVLVPVLRADTEEEALALVDALYAGGVDVMEVTTTVPNTANVLRTLRQKYGDSMLLGAGTVTTVGECNALLDAGAEFVVSPSLHPDVIEATKLRGKLMISGALTPTEIVTAWKTGTDAVKVFPCSAMGGAEYLRAIHGPFPQIPLIPTGGVTMLTAKDFLNAGAIALGVGSDLVNVKAIRAKLPEQVTEAARAYRETITEWKKAAEGTLTSR